MVKSIVGADHRIIDSNKPASDKALCGKQRKRLPMEFFCSRVGQHAVAMPGPARAVKANQVIEKSSGIGMRRYDGDAAAPACGFMCTAQLAPSPRWNADRKGIVTGNREHRTSCVVGGLTCPQRGMRNCEARSIGR